MMKNDILLKLKNVTLKFKNHDNPILEDISLDIKKGDFLILLGSNGSGKSSLIKILNGSYPLSKGEILYNSGLKVQSMNHFKRNNYDLPKIVTLTQNLHESLFLDLTVFQNCKLYHMQNNLNCNNTTLTLKDYFKNYLYSFNNKLSLKLNEKVKNLSGGEKQSLILALCLHVKPEILLLDEHTSALDPKASKNIVERTAYEIQKQNITCIMTTHNLSIAKDFGNKIVGLKRGKIKKIICKKQSVYMEDNECVKSRINSNNLTNSFNINDLLMLYN